MRLSAIQKDVLFILYAIEQKGNSKPVPSVVVWNMINKSRTSDVFDTNFRASCHKLSEHKMIDKYRSHSLKLAWSLSELGRNKAAEIYRARINT
ncbi:chromosome segregation protein ParM [Pseudoalteromonas luteoviolacea]|nr:chromosome segregation protein ParM [Pseudoalteromonas luteoviolacea]MBQ4839821.1 chromosome segregation protein ParM [Pseudoalteromonas luteoviolacea]